MAEEATKDFFISYNKADRGWAEWIAWQLEAEGYSTIIQAWDFRPGGNFVLQMDEATKHTKRTIAVLSPSYLTTLFTQPEWGAAFAQDPTGQQGMLLPIRVHTCELEGLLKQIVYIDLVGLDVGAARGALRAGVRQSRALPSVDPLFPGDVPSPLPAVPSFPGAWPEIWQVPYPRNPFFTGREDLLAHLHEQLSTTKPTALSQPQAISGLGGIGKTQTALEYAYHYGHDYRYVFWFSAVDEETLRAALGQFAISLQLPGHDVHNLPKTIEVLKQWLAQQNDWLLILDNADDLEMASRYVPHHINIQGHVLLTTRASTGGALAHLIEVETMDQQEGVLLLLRRAHMLAPDAPLDRSKPQDRTDAQAIVTAIDGLPLAIDQAAAYIEEMEIPLSSYLSLYQKRRKALLAHRGQLPPGHPETVATTWDLSFQRVEHTNSAAADLLRLCAFLAPDAIPESILTEGASGLGKRIEAVATDPHQLNAALQLLRRYSLIRRNRESSTLSVHRVVQAVLQDAMSRREQRAWAERAIRAVNAIFPSERWLSIQQVLPHALICADLIDDYRISLPEASRLLDRIATYLQDAARYQEAEPLFLRSLAIDEQVLPENHPWIAVVLENYGSLLRQMNRSEEAVQLETRVQAIRAKRPS